MSTRRRSLLDAVSPWLLTALIIVGAWVVQPFRIPSESMRETLQVDDYLLVSKWDFGLRVPMTRLRLPALHDPGRGEVIVFRYPRDPRQDYVKRCVAVGGQRVELRDKALWVDARSVDEPYVIHTDESVRPGGYDYRDNFGPYRVPPGEWFVMGDNRDDSEDSRMWGTVKAEQLVGRPLFVYWSWDRERHRPRWERILRWIR
jgi:signal peptidase I